MKVDLSGESDLALAAISFTRTTGTCGRPGVCFRNVRLRGKDLSEANNQLRDVLANNPDVSRRLRALWALHATGGLGEKTLQGLLDDASEHVRAWAIRLLCDDGNAPTGVTVEQVR